MKEILVSFADKKIENAFESLKYSSEKELEKFILRAIDDLKENPACGIHIPKKQIPEKYVKKYNVTNLWKYDLPKGWRLIYTIKGNEIEIFAILLEWLTHKEYDRLFKYHTS